MMSKSVPEVTNICPIKGVSEDCEECTQIGWGHCVYVKVWQERKKAKPRPSERYVCYGSGEHV